MRKLSNHCALEKVAAIGARLPQLSTAGAWLEGHEPMSNFAMPEPKPAATPTPDQCAAHEFLSELRTRISTQPLPYQYGAEARALKSLWEVFAQARAAMKKYPGCAEFADAVTQILNKDLRPVTAKWHRAYVEGRLSARDGADEFRGDLAEVQQKLRALAMPPARGAGSLWERQPWND
jgi:hypothetical protein